MRVRWRRGMSSQETSEVTENNDALDSLREANAALLMAKQQRRDGSLIAKTLSAIREENHFQEIWNEGLRGG